MPMQPKPSADTSSPCCPTCVSAVEAGHLAVFNQESELCRDGDRIPHGRKRFANDLFIRERAVDLGRVEERDAAVDRLADDRDTVFPAGAGSVAEADAIVGGHAGAKRHKPSVLDAKDADHYTSEAERLRVAMARQEHVQGGGALRVSLTLSDSRCGQDLRRMQLPTNAPARDSRSAAASAVPPTGALSRLAPGVAMLRGYQIEWLRYDVAAGLSVAAVALPTAIAYAQLAGFPPVVGLYASILPLVVYAILGTSRQLIVNPDAATCAMVAAIVAPLAGGDAGLYTTLAVSLAVFTGVACMVAGLFRLGFLADFLGKPVLVGFMNGIAISIAIGQIGKVFGFALLSERILPRLVEFVSKLGSTHLPTLTVGIITFAVMRGVHRFFPRLPAPLVALVVAVALVKAFALDSRGVVVLGVVPAGLPDLQWTAVPLSRLGDLVSGAAALALVSFTSGMITARSFAARNRYEIDVDREFIALGACNIAAGLSQGFAVTGADSRTAISDAMGGKTQVTGLVAAVTMALVLFFLTGPLQYLPISGLGAVLLSAAIGLFDWPALVRFFRIHEGEFLVCVAAMVGVVVLGALQGIALAIGLALLVLLIRSSRPADSVLGRVAGHQGFVDLARSRRCKARAGDGALSVQRVADLLQRPLLQAPGAGCGGAESGRDRADRGRLAARASRQHRSRHPRGPGRGALRPRGPAGDWRRLAAGPPDARPQRGPRTGWAPTRCSPA